MNLKFYGRKKPSTVYETLEKDVDSFSEKAESTTGTNMAELITKSNTEKTLQGEERGAR